LLGLTPRRFFRLGCSLPKFEEEGVMQAMTSLWGPRGNEGRKRGEIPIRQGNLSGHGPFPGLGQSFAPQPPFSILSFSLFCFYLKPFGKLSKLIQIETKSL
jgi:hypothetical protein